MWIYFFFLDTFIHFIQYFRKETLIWINRFKCMQWLAQVHNNISAQQACTQLSTQIKTSELSFAFVTPDKPAAIQMLECCGHKENQLIGINLDKRVWLAETCGDFCYWHESVLVPLAAVLLLYVSTPAESPASSVLIICCSFRWSSFIKRSTSRIFSLWICWLIFLGMSGINQSTMSFISITMFWGTNKQRHRNNE